MADQIKVRCGECGYEFMSGALPENRRCKNPDIQCNSANITEVQDEAPELETADGCENCTALAERVKALVDEIEGLEESNSGLTKENTALKARPDAIAKGAIVFELVKGDPFWKEETLLVTKKTKGGVESLEKYVQRAHGAEDHKRADAAIAAIAKIKGTTVTKYLASKAKK